MFQLTKEELEILRSQIATSSWGGNRYRPYAFTEHGVLMLSNVLKSERAIQMSLQIVRVFVQMRELVLTHKDILVKLAKIEKKITEHDRDLKLLFEAIKGMLSQPVKERVKIGYKVSGNKTGAKHKKLALA